MGLFAFYCGFVYNDFMSIALDFFGSCYNLNDKKEIEGKYIVQKDNNCVYPFGNKIEFHSKITKKI